LSKPPGGYFRIGWKKDCVCALTILFICFTITIPGESNGGYWPLWIKRISI